MPKSNVNLTDLFQTVTQALAENQQSLDQADDYNHDHGSNMVQTFQTITNALNEKQGSSSSTALKYAARNLSKNASSGSSKLYAENLTRAANQLKGKQVNEKNALDLLQTLIGSGQSGSSSNTASAGSSDMLGSLLGGLMGGETPDQSSTATSGSDMLSALLGGLTGSESGTSGAKDGLDLQDLLAGGMAYMQAKQSGGGTLQALVQAFSAASGMGSSQHRTQSTQVVVQSFLQALNAAGGKR